MTGCHIQIVNMFGLQQFRVVVVRFGAAVWFDFGKIGRRETASLAVGCDLTECLWGRYADSTVGTCGRSAGGKVFGVSVVAAISFVSQKVENIVGAFLECVSLGIRVGTMELVALVGVGTCTGWQRRWRRCDSFAVCKQKNES